MFLTFVTYQKQCSKILSFYLNSHKLTFCYNQKVQISVTKTNFSYFIEFDQMYVVVLIVPGLC